MSDSKRPPEGIEGITPVESMTGDSEKDTQLLKKNLEDARRYVQSFEWCGGIREAFFGMGVGGVVAVFLFQIKPIGEVDEWLWVVVGDLPSAYLVTDEIKTPESALEAYCELMMDWVNAVETRGDLSEVFPVEAPATPGNAATLRKRVAILREEFELA